jgi:uncharacterized protein
VIEGTLARKPELPTHDDPRRRGVAVNLGSLALRLFPEGAASVPVHDMLVVADLHLEKATAFAARGQMLPPYETLETLQKLSRLVSTHAPGTLVLLGDSFHSAITALDEAGHAGRALIDTLGAMTDLVWIAGNHDPAPPVALPGRWLPELVLDGVILRHAPVADGRPEIVGHLHPSARLPTRAGTQRRRCFLVSPTRLVLPAFGSLTGGLDVSDPAIAEWFTGADCRGVLLCRDALAAFPLQILR